MSFPSNPTDRGQWDHKLHLTGDKELYTCGAVEDCVGVAFGYSLEIQMGSALTQNVGLDLAQLDCFSSRSQALWRLQEICQRPPADLCSIL